ncbi:MAG: hypothetical protein Q4F58_01225 [Candidatus Saccharibacteria bacterium]|nr:hypothetical protein [Candidatus Saccharibacteria bacterium]
MNLDPSVNTFAEQDLTIKVGTNNFTGFKLYVTTPSNNTDLVNIADSTKTIPNLTSSYATSAFPVNNWGYRITQDASSSSGDYGVFTSSDSTPIMQSSSPTNEKMATLGFAAKIDYTKPSGLYELNLSFKALPIVTQYYMQELSDPTVAASVCTEDPTVVIDQRDEQPYLIQRLDDGRCWMLDNLNLDLTSRDIVNGMDSTNTNATDTVLGYLKNGGGTTTDQWAIDGLTYQNWTSEANTYSAPLINKSGSCDSSYNGGTPCSAEYQDKTYTHNDIIVTNKIGSGTYRIGIYYNFCAASAGSYCYGSGSSSGTPSGNAEYDICPAGWRMPTGGGGGEYEKLYNIIGNNDVSSPLSFQSKLSTPISGSYYQNTAIRQGIYGFFWSSTYNTDRYMYDLRTSDDASLLQPKNYSPRTYGRPIRCIAK